MKAKFFQFLLFIFIFSSCSNSKVISNQWVEYINSSNTKSLLASKSNHFLTNYDFKISNILNETNKEDSVVIVTKSGKKFIGLVTKPDFDGYFIKIQNNREIYISNIEDIFISEGILLKKYISSGNKLILKVELKNCLKFSM